MFKSKRLESALHSLSETVQSHSLRVAESLVDLRERVAKLEQRLDDLERSMAHGYKRKSRRVK